MYGKAGRKEETEYVMGKLQSAKIWGQKRCNLAESQNSFSWETFTANF